MRIKNRRYLNLGIFIILAGLSLLWYCRSRDELAPITYQSGWILLGLMLFLTCYNLRKKLSFLPLGKSSTWLQLHLYAGFLSALFFFIHTGFKLPQGQLELTMTILYSLIVISGILGIFITRLFPRRLSSLGEEIIFERIPMHRAKLAQQAEELALSSIAETQSTLIAKFYSNELATFFSQPQHFFAHLFEYRAPLFKILNKLDELTHYLNEQEKGQGEKLRQLIIKKYELDYSFTLQACLKYWLFIHIPFTYALLLFSLLHIILVHAFAGGNN